MGSILLLLISTVGLAGVFFNVRMLMLTCVKNQSKYTSLHKFRPFISFQFIYQVTILATTTIEAWIGINTRKEEFQYVVKTLTISMKILLVCNMVAISAMLAPDHPSVNKRRLLTILLAVAVFFGFTSEAVFWWHSHEFVPQRVILVTMADFLILLLAMSAINSQLDHGDEASTKPTSLYNIWIKSKTFKIFAAICLLLFCGTMVAGTLQCRSLEVLAGQENVFCCSAFLENSLYGILLPLALPDLLNLRSEKERESEVKAVVMRVS